MGQRANYIIKEGDKLTIYYTHWRSIYIAADLYLGEKMFLEFVNDCQINDNIIQEPDIEGCVIIDKPSRQLHFWQHSMPAETSVVDLYLAQLSKKWHGWDIHLLRNRMYDAEKVLQIDYISQQHLPRQKTPTEEQVINDKVEKWAFAVIVIKHENNLFVTKTGSLFMEQIISFGEEIVPLLKNKTEYTLPKEGEFETAECIIIDTFQKKLLVNKSDLGLWEESYLFWEGYEFTMGDFGYTGVLQMAGIDITNIAMPKNEVVEQFEKLVKQEGNFDSFGFADQLTKGVSSDIQFGSRFFDNVQPKKDNAEGQIE